MCIKDSEIQKLNEEVEKLKEELSRLQSIAKLSYNPNENIPVNCRNCSNHPSNGGSGICHCILGSQVVY